MDISTKFRRSAIATAVCTALLAPQASFGNAFPPLLAIDAVEVQANTSTEGKVNPAVATDADGDFVVVWNSAPGVACVTTARKFNADGTPVTAEITVNTSATACASSPDVAMDADGDFVVAWTDFTTASSLPTYDVLAQRYDSSGTAQGGGIQISSSTGQEFHPRVAMDADGDFAVAWLESISDYDLYFQRYDSSGDAQGAAQMMHAPSTTSQFSPDIAMDADGDLIAVWAEATAAVKGRLFPSTAPAGDEFTVATSINLVIGGPRVAADADGDFVVTWHNAGNLDMQLFSSEGTPSAPEGQVASSAYGGEVAMDADGDFAVTWGTDGGTSITSHAKLYNATGTLTGYKVVNSSVDGGEYSNSIAMDADGDTIVAWEPDGAISGTDDNNIYFRRFQGPEDVDLAVTTSASPDPVSAGGSLTYTATVTNNHTIVAGTTASQDLYFGGVGAATGTTLSDILPSGSSYVSASGTGWSCSETSGTVNCSLDGSILPTGSNAVDITVTAPATVATLSNSATVAANQLDTDTANNSDTLTTAMCNDYGSIALSAATASIAEDGTSATLTVSRSGGSCDTVTVDYATADDSATAGADYTATSGTLSWAAGDSTDKTITIPVIDDTEMEGDEAFTMTLSNPSLATLGSTTEATVTITYNDLVATDPTTDLIPTSGGGGGADPWWLMLAGLPLLRRRRR